MSVLMCLENGVLQQFNRVVLVSSFEDMYVPTYR
jgi:hypothetical protein